MQSNISSTSRLNPGSLKRLIFLFGARSRGSGYRTTSNGDSNLSSPAGEAQETRRNRDGAGQGRTWMGRKIGRFNWGKIGRHCVVRHGRRGIVKRQDRDGQNKTMLIRGQGRMGRTRQCSSEGRAGTGGMGGEGRRGKGNWGGGGGKK